MAPMDRPRTSDRWAIQPTRMTGTEATVAAADRWARYSPSWGTELIRNIGMVAALVTVRLSARNSSFQAKITQISAVETSPGEMTGKITSPISRIRPAPSSSAASSISLGTSSMNERISQMASGRFIAVYKMISTQMLSSRCVFSAITYRGPIAATIGSILVEMKKNRPSRQCGTGCTDRAYAAGTPSSSTRTVETVVAISEWVTYGPQPEKTRRNCARVGEKTNLGGQVWAADSGLNAVSTIHSTGRKNAMPTTQARTPQPTCPLIRRTRNPAGSRSRTGTAVAVAVAVISRLLELEDPGEHPQRERGHDDRQDDGHHPGGGRPADVERVIHLLVQVVGQVGGGGPRAALGHGLDLVEHVDQVD